MQQDSKEKQSYLRSPLATLWFAVYPWRKRWFLMCTLAFLGNGAEYTLPYFLKGVVDHATRGSLPPSFSSFLLPVSLVVAVLVLSEVSFRIAHIMEVYIVTGAFRRITASLYKGLLKRPTSYFEDTYSGDLGRRINQVGASTTFFIDTFPWNASWLSLAVVVAGILLATIHFYLLLLFLLWFVLFAVTIIPIVKKQYALSEKVATAHARLSGAVVDALGNIPLVHSSGAVSYEQERHAGVLGELVETERAARLVEVLSKFQAGLSVIVLGSALTITSVFLFTRGLFTIGDFIIVAGIIPSMVAVVWNLGGNITQAIREFGELSDAVKNLHTAHEALVGGKVARAKEGVGYGVEFKNISFQYPGTDASVFTDFSLEIKSGERVGIIGTSGAGKSTLMKLLLRAYAPQSGEILACGVPIQEFTLEMFYSLLGYVPQDTSLFHRTLLENIQYANPSATEEEVIRASKQAHAHEFIKTLPQGYQTKVGERGVKLSGGQRQRVALARAILKNAPILVLDEATSALDSESETLVQEGLKDLFEGKTVIAIAHRLSTLRAMDRIVVMEGGRVVESGSPQDLLAQEGSIFKRMWEHQKNGFI